MHHVVYKITNLVNGMIYIGKHSTSNLDDGYMGSCEKLTTAINNLGIHNFKKEILYQASSEYDALKFEASLVDRDFVNNLNTYNSTLGGFGSWNATNGQNFAKTNMENKWEISVFGKDLVKSRKNRNDPFKKW